MTDDATSHAALTRRLLLRRSVATYLAGVAGAVGWPAQAAPPLEQARPARRRPNVIVISFDDLAWNDFGCYGNDFHETPHIDRLASNGMRFTQAYAAAPVCSPTRAALMTGLYPARTGITDFLRDEPAPGDRYLEPRFRTVPEHLAGRGYRTVHAGKWHLSEDYSGPYRQRRGNPYAHGFDRVMLSEERYIGHGDMFFPYRHMPSVRSGAEREYLTDRLGADSARWIRRNAGAPFFMHISNYAVHYRWQARLRLIRKYVRKKRRNPEFHHDRFKPVVAAMIERCDVQVGRIVKALRDKGIADNTLILVTSDNGGSRGNRPLRGGKGALYEGGIRVPLIAFWPGKVAPGSQSDAVVSTIDILPTVKDLAGAGPWAGMDGVSLTGVLLRQERPDPRSVFWFYPHYLGGSVPSAAVRSGHYKLVKRLRTGAIELYDLAADRTEQNNIARRRPEVARVLHRRLRRHIREMRRVPEEPTVANYPVLADSAEPGDGSHRVLPVTGSAEVERVDGRLSVSSRASARVVVESSRTPSSDQFAFILDPGFGPRGAGPGGPRHSERPQVGVGLVKDAENYLTVTYDHHRRTVGWSLVVDGTDRSGAGEPEDLSALVGTVDLSADGARLALVASGTTLGVYVDQGSGWEFLFLLDIGGRINLADPRVRREWRFGVEVALAGGSHAPGGYQVRQR